MSYLNSPNTRIPGVVSTGIIFAFTYMCAHFIAPSSSSYTLSTTPPPFRWWQPLGNTCSSLLFSDFAGEKKMKKMTCLA
jgi:hypothetical protein